MSFLLWVDAVGGFLVCSGERARLGQASPDAEIEIPIFADLSRRHATIARDREGNVLTPHGETWLDDRVVREPVGLAAGAVIGLGRSVKLRFSRPHPLSGTARLDILSGHRTRPTTNAILLAAEALLLGPDERSHVVCRHWPAGLTLHRRGAEWRCSAQAPLVIDGQPAPRGGPLTPRSRIVGEHFSLSLEPLE